MQNVTSNLDTPVRLLINIIFIAVLISCSNTQRDNVKDKVTDDKSVLTFSQLAVRNAPFPLILSDINFRETRNIEVFNDGIESKLEHTIKDIYFNDCLGDSNQTYFSINDTYFATIRLRDSLYSIFMIIFQHTTGELDSKVLFYDMVLKEFTDRTLDFKIHGLYHLDNLKLRPTNLKEQFKIMTPEIELVDFDKDGITDYKFTRLYHNGTANAIETTVIKVSNNKIDTLDFKRQWIGQ